MSRRVWGKRSRFRLSQAADLLSDPASDVEQEEVGDPGPPRKNMELRSKW